MTSHRAVVVSYQALYFNLGVHALVPEWIFLAVESTKLETIVQNHYYMLQEELYEQPDKPQIVAAYKKPIVETFFPIAVQGNLMWAYIRSWQ